MTKEELEKEVLTLEKQIEASKTVSESYQTELETAQRKLKDINKIALPPVVFDEIVDAIENGINEFDFSDTDNFDKEFSIDYDNKVYLENFDLTNTTDLVEMIVEKVSKLFTEMDAPEDELDTTEEDNHPIVEEITVDGGETEVTVTPTEDEMEDFNKKVEETKDKSFKKRTWF